MRRESDTTFTEQKAFSEGAQRDALVTEIVLAKIPGAVHVQRAGEFDDKRGTDYWVTLQSNHQISVDVKFRKEDFSVRTGKEDLALETLSVVERTKIGWTLDVTKRTDYVLWIWLDTRRWALLPFLPLCAAFQQNELLWGNTYGRETQFTRDGNYHSECIFVPERVIYAGMYHRCRGRAFGLETSPAPLADTPVLPSPPRSLDTMSEAELEAAFDRQEITGEVWIAALGSLRKKRGLA